MSQNQNECEDEKFSSDEGRHCIRYKITEKELLCKNHCGFYGTPQWNGMCSACWRLYQVESKKINDYNKNRALLKQDNGGIGGGLMRKSSEGIRSISIRSLLKKSPIFSSSVTEEHESNQLNSVANSISTPSSPVLSLHSQRSASPDSVEAQNRLKKYFYRTFSPHIAKDFDKQINVFLDKLVQNNHLPLDDLSEMVQEFYQTMSDRALRTKPHLEPDCFKSSEFVEELENFICERAYTILFCSRTDEETSDFKLQERIRSLNWVTMGFLETALDFSSEPVQELLNEAITQIVDLNSHRSVVRKLGSLINCSKHIFDALKESRSGANASADEFLPVLILVILKANPPLIQSNMKFISRFSQPFRVMRGESGYYFTNLSCAIKFILDMDADSLRMNTEEFEAYTTGRRTAPVLLNSSAGKSIENSLKRLTEIVDTQLNFESRLNDISAKMTDDSKSFTDAVNAFIAADDFTPIVDDHSDETEQKTQTDNDKKEAMEEIALLNLDEKKEGDELSKPCSSSYSQAQQQQSTPIQTSENPPEQS